jgi:lipopolysaccharide biosynthesis glycosyltransferase
MVFGIDDNYAKYRSVAIASVLDNHKMDADNNKIKESLLH